MDNHNLKKSTDNNSSKLIIRNSESKTQNSSSHFNTKIDNNLLNKGKSSISKKSPIPKKSILNSHINLKKNKNPSLLSIFTRIK